MAVYVSDDSRVLRRAFAASLGLHVLFALLLPTWIRTQSTELQPIESLSFAHLVRLEISPRRSAPAQTSVQAPKRSRIASIQRVKSELSAPSKHHKAVPRPMSGVTGAVAAAPKRELVKPPSLLYARTNPTAEPVSAVSNPSNASPEPAAVSGDQSVKGENTDRGGVMPLGAAQDPVLDPRVLAELQRVGTHVTLVVRVGEDGKTERVDFDPPLDAQTERSIESILAQADWDAAICGGGVSCEGTATIKL